MSRWPSAPVTLAVAEAPQIEQIPLYDPVAILAALDVGAEWDDSDQQSDGFHSIEEKQWRRTLRQIAEDPRGPWRDVLVGTQAMAQSVALLDRVAPHFCAVTRLVKRALIASARTNTRLRLPPICLLGPPGVGKTFFARRCAKALGVHLVEIPMNLLNDRGRISGYSIAWRGARIEDLAQGILSPQSKYSGCIFVCDEIDKVNPRERLHDVLLSLLEAENASRFIDEYLTAIVPLRLDHAIIIATANDISQVPEPLLDRMLVINVGQPSGEDVRTVTASVYAGAIEPFGAQVCPFIDDDVFAILQTMSPRQIRRTLDLAIPVAIEDGRWALIHADLSAALSIMTIEKQEARFGFTR